MSNSVTLQDRFRAVATLRQEAESEFSAAGDKLDLGGLTAKARALRQEVEQFKQSTEELTEVASVGMIQRGDYESLLYMAEECGLDSELVLSRALVVDGRVINLKLEHLNLTNVVIAPGLTALKKLHLSNNQLSEVHIPDTLTALKRLYLDTNRLTEVHLPATLIALKWLDLNNNQLTEIHIPETLPALQWLYLNNNKLTEVYLPETLTALELLYLNNNQLTEVHIPVSFTVLSALLLQGNFLSQSTRKSLKTRWQQQGVTVYV